MTDQNIQENAADLIAKAELEAKSAELKRIAEETEALEKDTKKRLREQAKILGVTLAPNASLETMIAALSEAQTQLFAEPIPAAKADEPEDERAQFLRAREELRQEQLKLVRVRISNMNPAKGELPGEILTFHNDIVGTVRKFVPYGEAGQAFHVPKVLYDFMAEREFMQTKMVKQPNGRGERQETRMMKEFALDILPPLTEKELEKIAKAQNAAEVSQED